MKLSDDIINMINKYKEGVEKVEAMLQEEKLSDKNKQAIIKDYNPPLNMIARDIVDAILELEE